MILNIIWSILFLLSYEALTLYLIHMFQLNTYKPHEQILWMKKNSVNVFLKEITGLIGGIFVLFISGKIGIIMSGLVYFISLFFYLRKEKAKKPLVYTMRVKRLIFTNAVILIIAAFIGYFINLYYELLSLVYILSWFFVILSNYINSPAEYLVKRHYIKDAERIIKESENLKVIGITGSYGKTSVKFFLTALLSGKYNVLCTPQNYNTTMGVVKTIRENLTATHEIFVCEMGARYVGDIKEICKIVNPDAGIITSIGPQHLESFGSIENVVKTKYELYDSIKDNKMIFLNFDNEYIENGRKDKNIISYGTKNGLDYFAKNIKASSKGTEFVVVHNNIETVFTTNLIGIHNVQNIVGCIAVANKFGVDMKQLVKRVKKLKPVSHRLELLEQKGNITIIDDAYNSNPNGFKAAIDTLYMFDGVKVVITPGMIELGSLEYEENKKAGKYAAEKCDYIIIVGHSQSKALSEGVKETDKFNLDNLIMVNNIQEGFKEIRKINGENIFVLIENDLPDNYN